MSREQGNSQSPCDKVEDLWAPAIIGSKPETEALPEYLVNHFSPSYHLSRTFCLC